MSIHQKKKKNRTVQHDSTVKTKRKVVVTKDNPLYDLPKEHPAYDDYIFEDSSILFDDAQTLNIEDLVNTSTNTYDIIPDTSSGSQDTVTAVATLSTPTNISVDTVNYLQKVTNDGSIVDSVYISYDEVQGATKYEVRIVSQ